MVLFGLQHCIADDSCRYEHQSNQNSNRRDERIHKTIDVGVMRRWAVVVVVEFAAETKKKVKSIFR